MIVEKTLWFATRPVFDYTTSMEYIYIAYARFESSEILQGLPGTQNERFWLQKWIPKASKMTTKSLLIYTEHLGKHENIHVLTYSCVWWCELHHHACRFSSAIPFLSFANTQIAHVTSTIQHAQLIFHMRPPVHTQGVLARLCIHKACLC